MLYEVAPTVSVPDPCSAPKQRKMDSYSVSPNSLLGTILSQDQSIYCEHNTTNSLNTLNDVAFNDTHATVSVPSDVWLDADPKHTKRGLMKSDGTVQDMMETLQQILGESDLSDTLDVEPDELKSWENTLLKMSTSCEIGDDLGDILSNDIFSYVEEQLQREGGLKLPDQLDDIPPCLSTLDLQNQIPDQEQNFNWPLEPQNQLIPNGEQVMTRQLNPVQGMMKLTHIDLPLASSGFNGPTLQQITSQQPLPAAGGLQLGAMGDMAVPVSFNPSMMNSCAQSQNNQGRTLQNNSLGAFSMRPANQLQSSQMAQPQQNHLQIRNLPVAPQDQGADPIFNFQGNQWSSNQANRFVDSCSQNISKEQGFAAAPSSSSCLQGRFALQTQSSELQRQSWPLEQQRQQIPSGHQHLGACLNSMSGFQRNPLPGVVAVQNNVHNRPTFRTPETPNVAFPMQQGVASAPSSTCMFANAAPSTPSCQRLNPVSAQIPSKPSCFYQSLPGGSSVPGMTALPNPEEAPLSCKTATGINPDELLVQPQQYLNFSELHTQVNRSENTRL